MARLAQLVVFLGALVWLAAGVWGLVLDLRVLHVLGGAVAVLLGLVLFPITFILVPWYAALVQADWYPLAVSLGGATVGAILYAAGHVLAARRA